MSETVPVLSRKRGGKIKGGKAKHHPGKRARGGKLPAPDDGVADTFSNRLLWKSDRAVNMNADEKMETKPDKDSTLDEPAAEMGEPNHPRLDNIKRGGAVSR